MTQARHSSIYETMFDSRLGYVSELKRMGARIDISGSGAWPWCTAHAAAGHRVCALDIRSGAAMILPAWPPRAKRVSKNVVYIDRGYENIEESSDPGARISRWRTSRPLPRRPVRRAHRLGDGAGRWR
jgi:UDP-N-acetylglucosamine 1-carboxyvinyltransferase